MHNRLRLLAGATALLYFGPLLAGLAGAGWGIVPLFGAIFLLWLLIIRPHLWPDTWADWARSEALITLVTQIITQLLLVTILLGIGRGIGGALGLKPPFPALLPVAISFLAVPLARLVWSPIAVEGAIGPGPNAAETPRDLTLGAPINRQTDPDLVREILAPMLALPEESSDATLDQHLKAISAHLDPEMIRAGLKAAADQPIAIRARILHATHPGVADILSGPQYPAEALASSGGADPTLALFAARCALMIADEPDLYADCPRPDDLRARAATAAPETAAALTQLAATLDRLARPIIRARRSD